MGRELKRVPMNFSWPLKKVWGGYINGFHAQAIKCEDCDGSGYSQEARHLKDLWYGRTLFQPEHRGSVPFTSETPAVRRIAERNVERAPGRCGNGEQAIILEAKRLADWFNASWCHHLNDDDVAALVKDGRLHEFTSTWTKENGWQPKDPPYIPTAREVNEWSLCGLGHDSINCSVVVSAECARFGVSATCARCGGHGELWPSPEAKKRYEDWKPTEPPKGDGFQLWETTSEGSPISPVFASLEELCEWAAGHATVFGDNLVSKEEWMKMLNAGFVCHKEGNAVFI